MTKKSYIQDRTTGKLIPKEDYTDPRNRGVMIQADIEPFISPITKEVITSRSQLRLHNKKHGVTDSRDYSSDFIKKRSDARVNEMMGKTPQAHAERIECVKRTLEKFGL